MGEIFLQDNITYGIVPVAEVLQQGAVAAAGGFYLAQPEGIGIVLVSGGGTVLLLQFLPLAFGIVADGIDYTCR